VNILNPIVVSYGLGLDSTAMLVEMHNRGMRPDLILFADTGAEKPETYAYLDVFNPWLRSVGFPEVTVVKYAPVRAPYSTLEDKCLHNETMPALAYNGHSCSIVFKIEVLVKHLRSLPWVQSALTAGGKVQKCVGYDDSTADRKRRNKADKAVAKKLTLVAERAACGRAPQSDQWEAANCEYRYLLQDWSLERTALAAIIEAAGLPVPGKSACFFCPASQPEEVVQLKIDHPDLYERAVKIERLARDGKHGLTTKLGLGMGNWSWETLATCERPEDARAHLRAVGIKISIKEALRP
jgi:hypothetical protein